MPVRIIRCAPGATLGEEIAADFVRNSFANDDATLLLNYHHPNNIGTGTDEIDLVLINHRGVWVLETKHWYGHIEADPVDWMQANRRHPSPIRSIEMKARRVATLIRNAGFQNVSTAGLVLITTPQAQWTINISDPLANKVLRLDQSLIDAVTGNQFLFRSHNRRLSPDDIQQIEQSLARMRVDPQRQIVGSYRLLRDIESSPLYAAYEAEHVDVEGRRARVKRYELTGLDRVPNVQQAVRRFQQDMQALSTVEGNQNVVRAYDYLPDPDTGTVRWLILEWVDGPTLRDINELTTLTFDQQLHLVLVPLARAIQFCHSKNIIHRNITPSSIYINNNRVLKLGDFDFARVPAMGTISVKGEPLVSNRYTAPEIQDDASAADERSDIYSLGAVWYDTIFKLKPDETILLSRVDQAEIPDQARQVLRRLIAPQPFNRPTSAAEVVQLLQNLRS